MIQFEKPADLTTLLVKSIARSKSIWKTSWSDNTASKALPDPNSKNIFPYVKEIGWVDRLYIIEWTLLTMKYILTRLHVTDWSILCLKKQNKILLVTIRINK